MTDFLDQIRGLSSARLALLAVELKERLDAAQGATGEAIAIVGIGCRFPGADGPAAFWKLLVDGRDEIREIPPDRWSIDEYYDEDPDAPGKMSTRFGAFLDRIDTFDPHFFGIAPREALAMDPQQRLLLEVSWEALEHAGIAPASLMGSRTGVFVGICNTDYHQLLLARGPEALDAYVAPGNAHSVAAGRVSYVLGLQGPSLSIDTSCSASLVAIHAACQSLRMGESALALAGGVNVICAPDTSIALSRGHMLAPDGRCKTFDAMADGFSRGEGCGMVVLKRLSDARRDGDSVLALVRGSAVNQDGRSGGLTVPNGPAQEAVIREALSAAGIAPGEVDYVEAHGTGTSLGDPIEVRALSHALGEGRTTGRPLLIGSVKTNFGHLESAAGVAGLIKVILSLQNEEIPQHLNFVTPSPHIEWDSLPVAVASERRAWPRGTRARRAGVSSFGFSGTNSHLILEESPAAVLVAPARERPLHLIPMSARTEPALRTLAGRYAEAFAADKKLVLADAAYTAGIGRSHLAERMAVIAADEAEARAALEDFAAGRSHPGVRRGSAVPGVETDVVFLYTGAGAQYPGMGQALYESSSVYRDVIDRCDAILGADSRGLTLKAVLAVSAPEGAPIHDIAWTQPALFATEYALTELWRSWGVEPAAVIGHSAGEYVAATVAGVFSLEDGLRLVAERGRLMQALAPGGTMAALYASADEVAAAISPMADRVAIAAINAPDSVVVSGETAAIESLLALFAQRNVQGQRLFVSIAAHSPLVEPALDAMESHARAVPMSAPRIPIASNLTGEILPMGHAPDAFYWRRHMREPVRFADGVTALSREGYRIFLEVGPHPTLLALAQRSLPEDGSLFLTSLRRGKEDWRELLTSVADLYVHGISVDWDGVGKQYAHQRATLPTYPFERSPFWIAPSPSGARPRARATSGALPLLGERLSTADPAFESVLTPDAPSYLGEHRVHGAILVAASVFLEIAQAAALAAFGARRRAIENLIVREPLILPEHGRAVQVHLGDSADGVVQFRIHSRALDEPDRWQLHVTGQLVDAVAGSPIAGSDVTAMPVIDRRIGPATGAESYYDRLARVGIQFGPSFRGLQEIRCGDGEALGKISLPALCAGDPVSWAHPSLIDAALQVVGVALPESPDTDDVFLLTELARIDLAGPLPATMWAHALIRNHDAANSAQWVADVTLRSTEGDVLGSVRGACLRRARREALVGATAVAAAPGLFYEVVWEKVAAEGRAAPTLEAPSRYAPSLRAHFGSNVSHSDLSIYHRLVPELDRLAATHIAIALRELNFDWTVGRSFVPESEAGRLQVAPRYTRLFVRLLGILTEDGVLVREGERLVVAAPVGATDPSGRYETLLAQFRGNDGELGMLRRCGGELSRVLRGERDPLQLLFPEGSFVEVQKVYAQSPHARKYNEALAEALRMAIGALGPERRLRVLEIGAGTGGTTACVLPLLPPAQVDYTFTDISPLFLERATARFANYPFLHTALLDIEQDPAGQGFDAGTYDIVIAANVLHATADLRQSIAHASRPLAPGGQLFLVEGVTAERWVDLTFGLTEGWWRFADTAIRPDYPLISRERWLAELVASGFTEVAAIPDDSFVAAPIQHALIIARAPIIARRWTIIADDGGVGTALAARLRERGDSVALIAADTYGAELAPADGLVLLSALDLAADASDDAATVAKARRLACDIPLEWLARLLRDPRSGRAWLFSRGAQSVGGEASPNGHWQAPLWGVGRVFALEQPARWGGLIDLAPNGTIQELVETILMALDTDDLEDQTAWRHGGRFGARLVSAAPPAECATEFHPDATYLVTGGFGGLGLIVARWMVEHGARTIALLGRNPNPAMESVRAIEGLGARVVSLTGDVGDEDAMRTLFRQMANELPPLRGIMHAAADFSVAPIGELTQPQVAAMLRPKVDGSVVLERLTRDHPLDFCVLFSSTTALLGVSGFAHYAAASTFLDAFARSKNRRDRHVVSINWGTWDAMRLASPERQQSYRQGGLVPLPSAEALDALGSLVGGTAPGAVVARIDWGVLKPVYEARRLRPFLSRMSGAASPSHHETRAGPAARLVEKLSRVPVTTRRELLVDFVRNEVAEVLGRDTTEPVPPDAGLFGLGMDSLMSVELRRRLERGTGRALPSTLTFNYPSIAALASFLEKEFSAVVPDGAIVDRPPPGPANADLTMLSDAELEARLLARLEQSR